MSHRLFFREFVRNFHTTGAILPSGRRYFPHSIGLRWTLTLLTATFLRWYVDLEKSRTVVSLPWCEALTI